MAIKVNYSKNEVVNLLTNLFDDSCACNYCGNDEWLAYCCDVRDTECPHPDSTSCWEQYLKHLDKKDQILYQ